MGWLIVALIVAGLVVVGHFAFSDDDSTGLGPIGDIGGGSDDDDHEFPPRRE